MTTIGQTLGCHHQLAALIRQALPDLIEDAGVDTRQSHDENLALMESFETGFRVHLENGASFNIRISTHDPLDVDDDCPVCDELFPEL